SPLGPPDAVRVGAGAVSWDENGSTSGAVLVAASAQPVAAAARNAAAMRTGMRSCAIVSHRSGRSGPSATGRHVPTIRFRRFAVDDPPGLFVPSPPHPPEPWAVRGRSRLPTGVSRHREAIP